MPRQMYIKQYFPLKIQLTYFPQSTIICHSSKTMHLTRSADALEPVMHERTSLPMRTNEPLHIDLIAHQAAQHAHQAMIDQPLHIQLSGFHPRQPVTIHAQSRYWNAIWQSQATFLTDDQGTVDLRSQQPLSGTYTDADPMGLFWSMRPDPTIPYEAQPYNTVMLTAEENGQPLASATLEQLLVAPDVARIPLREHGLVGTLFLPPGPGPHPALLVLGGSRGGLDVTNALMFASHGYAALALAYFGIEHLPSQLSSIPLEYFETAIQWMQAQPAIDGDKLGVVGWSKGGELSLLLAATLPQFKIAIGYVPSAVVFQGLRSERSNTSSWSFHGNDLPYVPVLDAEPYDEDAWEDKNAWEQVHYNMKNHLPISFTPGHLAGLRHKEAVEKATIPVEKILGPVLVISGTDDQVWPSTILSDMVIARLAQHRHPYPYKHLRYEGAGHTIGIPYQPTTVTESNFGHFKMALGGTPQANAFARHDSWPQVLNFLAQRLQS